MWSELTDEQRLAVHHRATSVVLASGAGCGKTHVLTERYISHLKDDRATVSQVAAITFTERAAREMRERIRCRVESLPDAARHLRDLESAPIATFHSFCGNLLRQFAIPAGLDPAFEVLDDVLAANLRADAVSACLRGLLSAEEPYPPNATALRELIVLFGHGAVVQAIDSLLLEIDRPAWEFWCDRPPEEIATDWLMRQRQELLPRWVAYLCAASPKIARCLALLEHVQSPNPEAMERARLLREGTPRLHLARHLAASVMELTELAKVGRGGKKDWPDGNMYEALKEAFTDFRADLPRRLELFASDASGVGDAAHTGQLFIRVALAADDEYRRRKRRAAVLDFQDLLTITRDLLRDRAEVRQALRQRFKFILVDELQDTDPVQMELVELLAGPAEEHNKLFAVGDHKQSIYRFRGAEVGLFVQLRDRAAAAGRLALTRNFRSQPGIIHFVNALFARRLADYEALVAHQHSASSAAPVEFLWAVAPGASDGKPKTSAAASIMLLRTAEADAIARRISELLADPAPRVLDKSGAARRVERQDIALLFRSMTHAAIYESALRRAGLDYYLIGGRAFFAQQEVYDLLNLLRAVENPQDSTSLVGALRSPFLNLSDESIVLLATHPDGAWAGLHDSERLESLPAEQKPAAAQAVAWLSAWREVKDRLPIAALLNRIMADSGYDAALQFEFLGDRKLANLWKLIDLARSFDRSGLFGLHEFTARLGDLVARQPREEQAATLPENADVVKLMSIHQAKGLEFPVVFVLDFAAQGRGGRNTAARWHRGLGCLVKLPEEFESLAAGKRDDDDDASSEEETPPFAKFADELGRTADQLADWQEDLRVLYVACTRARDLLVLSAGLEAPLAPGDHLPGSHWTFALEERFELRTGTCLSACAPGEVPHVQVRQIDSAEAAAPVHSPPERPEPEPKWTLPKVPPCGPVMPSLPVLEASARGEAITHRGEHFDAEDDGDRSDWRSPRERVGPVSPGDALLWAVLDRWDFADMDGWVQWLTDAQDTAEDRKLGEAMRSGLRAFAESEARSTLAAAEDLHRSVEFVADLSEASDCAPSLKIRGVIDFLYRDAAGWRILAIDRGIACEDDPWRGRRPGLVLQAWAVFKQFGEWPGAIELFDLAAGQLVRADPKRVSLAGVIEHFQRLLLAG